MKGVNLRFYMHENRKVHGVLLYEWLLALAQKTGLHGGTAFKAMAGFGSHGRLHEAKFFELAGDLTVEVEFLLTEDEAENFLSAVRAEHVHVFCTRQPVEFETIEGKN
jgi:PII-like signaling protein